MLISEQHRAVFIHVPKTGGSVIADELQNLWPDADSGGLWFNSNPYMRVHATARQIAMRLGGDEEWDEYLSFAFVRNPWDRIISAWSFLTREEISFDKFLNSVPHGYDAILTRPQVDFITDHEGRRMVGCIGRFENLSDDYLTVASRWKAGPLWRKLNGSAHRPYQEYYNPRLIDTIGNIYIRDVEMFGYSWTEEVAAG